MTIRSIQERSGANVQIPQGPDHDNPAIRTVNITHPNKEGAEFAKTLIEETLATKLNHGGGVSYGAAAGAAGSTSVTVQVSTLLNYRPHTLSMFTLLCNRAFLEYFAFPFSYRSR